MVPAKNLRKGNALMYDGKIQIVLENSVSKKARGSAVVKLKLRSIEDNAIRTITFQGDGLVEPVILEKVKFTCLYSDAQNYYFMNNSTYEQVPISKEFFDWEWRFLAENMECELTLSKGKFVALNLPEKVKLRVISAPPAVRGDSINNPQKDIIVETNFQLKAPLFIKENEYIFINTSTGKYSGKAS